MKYSKEFTITPGMSFEQIVALEKSAKAFFEKMADLGEAVMFNRGPSMVVRYSAVEPNNEQVYGEITSDHYETGKVDGKGRSIGFVAVYRDNGVDFRCYVQSTRDGKEFGVPQRSKSFKSAAQAKAYGVRTASERVQKAQQ